MAEIHYLISEASKKVDVESHVLRYWEEELGLEIPRNDMGHRYYTEVHIKLFQKVKELKEKGYQLKAIKRVLSKMLGDGNSIILPDGGFEEDIINTLKMNAQIHRILQDEDYSNNEIRVEEMESMATISDEMNQDENENENEPASEWDKPKATVTQLRTLDGGNAKLEPADIKMEQFQQIMNQIIKKAVEANNERLSQDISRIVNDKIVQELEYMMRISDEKEEERFRQLDETLRTYQKDGKGRAEAAASKIPFFKRKKFIKASK